MPSYVQPTKAEFEAVLEGYKQMKLPGTVELVYGKRVDVGDRKLSIRVYTSLNPDGLGRDVGKDAIKVCLYAMWNDKPVRCGTQQRVNRTKDWQVRLLERIKNLTPGPECPTCGAPMVIRKGANGKFWGCTEYKQGCRGTRNI